jgi:hypothetical protein
VPTTAAHVGIKFGYTTSGNNRAVLQDSSGNLYVTQKDDNTTYSAMTATELSTGTATTARTMTAANTKAGLLDLFYPVGSYYETSDTNFNPNTAWGGTWKLDSAGKVTVARDANDTDFDTLGETGGVKTHTHTTGDFTLTTNHIPAHTHGSKTLTGGWKDNSMCSINSTNKLANVSGIVTRATSKGDQYYTTSGRTKTANQYDEITITATHTL